MRAVCHIGLPKTGTTTIQAFLFENRQALEKQGFLYRRFEPQRSAQSEYLYVAFRVVRRIFDSPLIAFHHKIWTLEDLDDRVARFEKWVVPEIAKSEGHTWLISCEILTAHIHGPPGVRALHEWLTSHFDDVKYVIYLRRQDLWLTSEYSQKLRAANTETFEEFLAHHRPPDFMKKLQPWINVIGKDSIKVRLFERGALKDGDLIADYCDTVGIDAHTLVRPNVKNSSFTKRSGEFVRRINMVAHRVLPRVGYLNSSFRKLGRILAKTLQGNGSKITMDDQTRARILQEVALSNEQLRKLYFPHKETLFEGMPPMEQSPVPAGEPTSPPKPPSAAPVSTDANRTRG